MNSQRLIKSVVLFFVFLFIAIFIIWEIKWFSNSLGQFFYEKAVASASDSLQIDVIKKPEINPTIQQEKYSKKIDAKSFISIRINKYKTGKGGEVLFRQNEEQKL